MKASYKIGIIAIVLAFLFSFFYIQFLSAANYVVYVCQVGMYEQEKNAEGMVSSLQALEYQGDISNQGELYVVYSDVYSSQEQAQEKADSLQAAGFSVAIKEYVVEQDVYQEVENTNYEGMVWE